MKDMDSIREKLEGILGSRSGGDDQGSKEGRGPDRSSGSPGGDGSSPAGRSRSNRYVLGRSPRTGGKVTVPADVDKHCLIAGMTGTGKSCKGESEIVLFDREKKNTFKGPIENFVHEKLGVPKSKATRSVSGRYLAPSLSADGEIEWKPVTHVHVHEVPEGIVRVALDTGRELKVTPDHSVLALSGSEVVPKEGGEIEEGNVLFAPSKLDVPDPDSVTIEEFEFDSGMAELFGFYVADGNPNGGNAIKVSHGKDADFFEMRRICEELGFDFHHYEGSENIDVRSNGLGKLAEKYFGARAREKRVPREILFSAARILKSFLRGYFSCDGSIEEDGRVFCASSASEQLIGGLQLALRRLGVHTGKEDRIAKTSDWNEHRTYWRLRLKGAGEVEKFRKTVGLIQEDRSAKLACDVDFEKSSPKHETLPLAGVVKRISEDALISLHALSRRAGLNETTLVEGRIGEKAPKVSTLKRLVRPLEERISVLQTLEQKTGLLEALSHLDRGWFVRELREIGRGRLGLSYRKIGRLSETSCATARRTLRGKTSGPAVLKIAAAIASEAERAGLEAPSFFRYLSGENLSSVADFLLSFREKLVADSSISLGVSLWQLGEQDEVWPKTLATASRILLERFSKADAKSARERLDCLKRLLEFEAVPVRVEGVETADSDGEFVYDLSVEDNENFLAEGVFVHNSTFLLSQMLQDVRRGHSVILIDPHGGAGGLSHKFLSHIPGERWDDVVYINPMTAFDEGRLVKINFLQPRRMETDLVREMFIDALKRTYPEFWGPRLENILTHALMLLFATGSVPTIKQLTRVVPDRGNERWDRVEEVRERLRKGRGNDEDEEIADFWTKDFRDMDPRSYTSVMNKIYKMMTASPMRPFARVKWSSVDLYEKINEGGIIVVEIPKGKMTENISAFFGSIFLARIAQLAMQREDIPEGERRPVHVYVDEAHTFITDIIQRNMQELRKFGVFLTACSQNLQRYSEAGSENVLPELTDYTVAFRCGEDTAKRLGEKFATRLARGRYPEPWKPLTKLRDYEFYAAVPIGTSIEVKKAKTIDVGVGEQSRGGIVARSLENHGDVTRRRKRETGEGDVTVGLPHLTPARFFVLHYLDRNEWDRRKNLIKYIEEYRRIKGTGVVDAVDYFRGEYIVESTNIPWLGKEAESRNPFLYLAEKGGEALYPVIEDIRAGGVEHISMMCQAMRKLRFKQGEMVAPVLPEVNVGGGHVAAITEAEVEGEGEEIYPDLMVYYDHTSRAWYNTKAAAVEVDARPKKRRFEDHFVDNRDRIEVPTIVVVGSGEDADFVKARLEEKGAKIVNELTSKSKSNEAEIMVVDPEDIEPPSAVEAEHDPDKRLYRQVKNSCRANGKLRDYRKFIRRGGEESAKTEEPSPSGKEESKTEEGEAGVPLNIPETLDRVEELGKEGRTEGLRNEVQKLKDAGCEFDTSRRGRVKAKYMDGEEEVSREFKSPAAVELGRVLPASSSVGRGGSPSEAGEERPEEAAEEGPSPVEAIVKEVEDSVEGGSMRDLRSELERLGKEECSIEVPEDSRVKITWDEGERKRSVIFGGEEGDRIIKAMEGEEEASLPEEAEKPESTEEGGEKGEGQEEGSGRETKEEGPEEQGSMSDQERREWENKPGKEKWNEVEQIVDELRSLKKEGSSSQALSEKLRGLKERGCSVFTESRGEYQYLMISKSISGKTRKKSAGGLDEKWKEASEMAGLDL